MLIAHFVNHGLELTLLLPYLLPAFVLPEGLLQFGDLLFHIGDNVLPLGYLLVTCFPYVQNLVFDFQQSALLLPHHCHLLRLYHSYALAQTFFFGAQFFNQIEQVAILVSDSVDNFVALRDLLPQLLVRPPILLKFGSQMLVLCLQLGQMSQKLRNPRVLLTNLLDLIALLVYLQAGGQATISLLVGGRLLAILLQLAP